MIIDDVIVGLDKIGKDLGFEVDVDFDWLDKGKIATITFKDGNNVFLTVAIVYWRIENIINIYDRQGKNLYTEKVPGTKDDISLYDNLMKETKQVLEKEEQQLLNTPERIYDYGEENNWQGITNKQYELLSQDANLARMAVADMQDKGIVVPEILQKFRRYSMSFKETIVSKIAKEQRTKQQINRVARINKKAAEDEDLDVKLKIQKNKPAGLDTTSPKSLPESIRPMMQDLKDKITTLKETEAELANTKAGLDAQYQKAKDESKIVEKQAEIENLTTNIGKLLFAAKNETFQFQDNLVALTHQVKTVPAKATDKWKFEKVFAKLEELMGKDNAQKFLDNTLNGLQSQATEKTITELNIFSPTQKQMKQSDTSDTNKFIDALKEIYVNLRNYYLDVKKANNIIERELATGATASKKQFVTKKASIMVKMELPLANYMEMLKDRAKEIGRSLYLADELEDYLSNFDTVPEPIYLVDNYLINGEFIEREGEFGDSEWYDVYDGDWNKFCENEALFYNDEEACLNLGYSW